MACIRVWCTKRSQSRAHIIKMSSLRFYRLTFLGLGKASISATAERGNGMDFLTTLCALFMVCRARVLTIVKYPCMMHAFKKVVFLENKCTKDWDMVHTR